MCCHFSPCPRLQGIVRLKPVHRAGTAAKPAGRYGYTVADRRDGFHPYSTNLTNAEYDLVADWLDRAAVAMLVDERL